MWGNIAVEETVDVRHSGAQLKVTQSRQFKHFVYKNYINIQKRKKIFYGFYLDFELM